MSPASAKDLPSSFAALPPTLQRGVELFKEWADRNPNNAAHERMSIRELFAKHLDGLMLDTPVTAGSGEQVVRRGSAAVHLKAAKTRNQPWWALCYWALQLYDDQHAAPTALRYFAGEYAKRLEWPMPNLPPSDGVVAMVSDPTAEIGKLKDRVRVFVSNPLPTDLADMAAASEQLATLLFETRLNRTSDREGTHVLDSAAAAAAQNLCDLAQVLTNHVDAAATEVTDDVRRCCATVFDAAIHAHRRRARTPGREINELGLLAAVRERDMRITAAIRTNVEIALMRYHGSHSGALLRESGEHQLLAEIHAAQRLIAELTAFQKAAVPGAFRVTRLDGRRPTQDNIVDIDRLVGVACRLACAVAASPEVAAAAGAVELRVSLLKLFPHCQERHDVRWLLTLAAGPPGVILGASEVLRVARIRGVGDFLLARMFASASTADEHSVDARHRGSYRLFQPEDEDLLRRVADRGEETRDDESAAEFAVRLRARRREMLLQRSFGLYTRAIVWLRESGSAGQLRTRAERERADVESSLTEPSTGRAHASVVGALSGLRHRLEEMIVDGFLWADIDEWTNMNDDKVAFSARRLSAILDQAQRYLAQPELGVRTET